MACGAALHTCDAQVPDRASAIVMGPHMISYTFAKGGIPSFRYSSELQNVPGGPSLAPPTNTTWTRMHRNSFEGVRVNYRHPGPWRV